MLRIDPIVIIGAVVILAGLWHWFTRFRPEEHTEIHDAPDRQLPNERANGHSDESVLSALTTKPKE